MNDKERAFDQDLQSANFKYSTGRGLQSGEYLLALPTYLRRVVTMRLKLQCPRVLNVDATDRH